MKLKLKVGDQVRVVTGDHKGLEGKLVKVDKSKNKGIVEGVNLVSKHEKPSATNPQGGIKEKEAMLHLSNLSLIDGDGKSTRVGYRTEGDKKIRFAKTTNKAV